MSKLTGYPARRAIYFIVAAVLAILVAAGWISEEQYASWTEIIEESLPLLGSLALFLAGLKTHPGSDDRTTKEDVANAKQAVVPTYEEPSPVESAIASARHAAESTASEVRTQVDSALESARAAYRDATRRE